MSKNLHTLQVIAKIGKVISKIAFIGCVIGAIGCFIGMVALGAGVGLCTKGDVDIAAWITEESGMTLGTLMAEMLTACIFCIGSAGIAKFSLNYFGDESEAGTPFTYDGAKTLFRLGILSVVIPIGCGILAGVGTLVLTYFYGDVVTPDMEGIGTFGYGITCLLFSAVFRYGAELNGDTEE